MKIYYSRYECGWRLRLVAISFCSLNDYITFLGAEFGQTDTVDRSGMVQIVRNRSDFVEIWSENR